MKKVQFFAACCAPIIFFGHACYAILCGFCGNEFTAGHNCPQLQEAITRQQLEHKRKRSPNDESLATCHICDHEVLYASKHLCKGKMRNLKRMEQNSEAATRYREATRERLQNVIKKFYMHFENNLILLQQYEELLKKFVDLITQLKQLRHDFLGPQLTPSAFITVTETAEFHKLEDALGKLKQAGEISKAQRMLITEQQQRSRPAPCQAELNAKRFRRMEKNRVSAAESRLRKKQLQAAFEQSLNASTELNQLLLSKINELKRIIATLVGEVTAAPSAPALPAPAGAGSIAQVTQNPAASSLACTATATSSTPVPDMSPISHSDSSFPASGPDRGGPAAAHAESKKPS